MHVVAADPVPLTPAAPVDPCVPSPCGPYSTCVVTAAGSPSCSCLPAHLGAPPNCRPECISNSDCSYQLACINQKCRDPCPGSCGLNAECRVVMHTPNCVCIRDYIGDPFTACNPRPSKPSLLPLTPAAVTPYNMLRNYSQHIVLKCY